MNSMTKVYVSHLPRHTVKLADCHMTFSSEKWSGYSLNFWVTNLACSLLKEEINA